MFGTLFAIMLSSTMLSKRRTGSIIHGLIMEFIFGWVLITQFGLETGLLDDTMVEGSGFRDVEQA